MKTGGEQEVNRKGGKQENNRRKTGGEKEENRRRTRGEQEENRRGQTFPVLCLPNILFFNIHIKQ